jgi:N-acetylmuramoyl-L-alanine amidase
MKRRNRSIGGRIARRAAAAVVLAALLVAGAPGTARGSARSDYERVLARVEALRLDGPRPTPRPQVRRVIAECETVARKHAGSGYADNALWQGANVALGAFRVWRQPADRARAVELLDTLVKRYPSSSLTAQARALIRRHTPSQDLAKRPAATPPARGATSAPSPAVSRAEAVPVPVRTAAAAPATELREPAAKPRAPETASGRIATLRGLRRTMIGDTVRLTLDFDAEVSFEQQRLGGPDRVYFDFARTQAIGSLSDTVLQFEGPAVRRVRLGRPRPDVTRLVIDLDGVDTYSVFALYHPFRLTIDLQPQRATLSARAETPAPAPAPPRLEPRPAPAVPRLDARPAPVVLPAAMPAPAPPPELLRSRALASQMTPAVTAAGPRVLTVEPLLAVDAVPVGARKHAVATAPALHPRALSRPPLLKVHALRPYMLRAAFVPPASRQVTRVPKAAERLARSAPRASAPVAPLPILPPVLPSAPSANGDGGFSIARQLGLGASRIVIDPGHGGKDPGAPGPKTTEAEVVLDVALRVEKLLLASPGIEVVLTRRDDTFIPLEERTALANRQAADLFVSIHANSSRNRKAAGVETTS